MSPFEFEKFLIENPDLDSMPKEAVDIYLDSSSEGVPTGISRHPKYGLAVICSAGQGPMILWSEYKEEML